jgi:hypothetical protein
MVICIDATYRRFHSGSSTELAKRNTRRFSIGSLPRKWSMRKTDDSGKARWSTWFSSRAERRSRPKGFSTTTRAPLVSPSASRRATTSSKRDGGMAR